MAATGAGSGPTIRIPAGIPDRERALQTAIRETEGTNASVLAVGPTGAPFAACSCTVDSTTAFHADPTIERIGEFAVTLANGTLPTAGAHAVVDHARGIETLPVPETGPLSVGTRRALAPCGWVDPTRRPESLADSVDPESALEHVSAVGLRGRGRADGAREEPIADTWRRADAAEGNPVVVVHAADVDAPADALLCRGAAGHVLDTAQFVAGVVGATDVIAFATESAGETLEAVDADVPIIAAPRSFLVGEPSMALESLEGADRIEARRRPPGPEEWGLYGRPTVIHTPRTLLQIRALLTETADVIDESANTVGSDPGTRLVSIRGAVAAPATVELRTDRPLSGALEAVEPTDDRTRHRYVVGGRFGGLTKALDVPASAPALQAATLGTEGVVEVLSPEACVVATVGERVAFAREENCGRCVPCREGSKQLHELLRDVYDGEFDDDGLRTLARVVETTSLCAFGEAASRPVRTGLSTFESTFRAHAEGRCPADSCEGLR